MLKLDVADNKAIGDLGACDILHNLPEGSSVRVLTHCNTGSLATAGYGTALGVIRSLREMGKLGKYSPFDCIILIGQVRYVSQSLSICFRTCLLHGDQTI